MSVDKFDPEAYWKAVNEASGGRHLHGESCFIEDREFNVPPEDGNPDNDPNFCDGEGYEDCGGLINA